MMVKEKSVLVYSPQLLSTGGIESHIQRFCKSVAEWGVLIDLVVPNFAGTAKQKSALESCCRTFREYKSESSLKRTLWLVATLSRLNLRGYDAIYTNGQGSSIGLVARVLKNRRRWVHHHHTSGDQEDIESWSKSYHHAIQQADHVIACSETNAGNLSDAVPRTFLSIPCFSRQLRATKPENLENRGLVFGYFGRLIKEKGIELLCQLSEDDELSDIEFHLWGAPSTYNHEHFEKYPQLRYHGPFRGEQELQKVVDSIDAFILASTHPEGLPISLLEVMSAGKPWIATDRGGIRDIAFDKHSTILLPVEFTAQQVKDAIRQLADDIRANRVDTNKQCSQYQSKYSEDAIRHRWRKVLLETSN